MCSNGKFCASDSKQCGFFFSLSFLQYKLLNFRRTTKEKRFTTTVWKEPILSDISLRYSYKSGAGGKFAGLQQANLFFHFLLTPLHIFYITATLCCNRPWNYFIFHTLLFNILFIYVSFLTVFCQLDWLILLLQNIQK